MQHAKSLLCAILCAIGVPLANAQSFWEYSAQGSFFDLQGVATNISGSLVIDGTVRAWNPPNLPSVPSSGLHAFLISSFDLDIGGLDFFGAGQGDNMGNSLYMQVTDRVPGTFAFGSVEWFLDGSGDFTRWRGDSTFYNSDGTRASVLDIFEAPPALVKMGGAAFCADGLRCNSDPTINDVQMNFTRVAQVAPIPEPEIYAMLGVGLAMLGWVGRRKRLKERAPA